MKGKNADELKERIRKHEGQGEKGRKIYGERNRWRDRYSMEKEVKR